MSVDGFSALLAAIASAGPWVLLVALLILIGVGLLRKWWVPGWLYEDVEFRLKEALSQAVTSAAMTKELTDIVTTALVRRGDWVDRPSDREYPAPVSRRSRGTAEVDRERR